MCAVCGKGEDAGTFGGGKRPQGGGQIPLIQVDLCAGLLDNAGGDTFLPLGLGLDVTVQNFTRFQVFNDVVENSVKLKITECIINSYILQYGEYNVL